MQSQLLRLTDELAFGPAGLPFKNTNQLRWLHRNRHTNGFAAAFVKIGKNVALDVPKFHEIARSMAAADSATGA
jgi:hypothetical protein